MSATTSCPGRARHWFTIHGLGLRSPVCVRCGAENPRKLSRRDWAALVHVYENHRESLPPRVRHVLYERGLVKVERVE